MERIAPRAAAVLLALAGLTAPAVAPAAAQTLDGYVEFGWSRTRETNRTLGQPAFRTDLDTWAERLYANYNHPLLPNLTFQAGGYFEREAFDGVSFGQPVDAVLRRLRPSLLLRLRTPTFQADLGATRDERRDTARTTLGSFTTSLTRDVQYGTFGWYPDPQNYLQLQVSRGDEYDSGRTLLDRRRADLSLNGQIRPWDFLVAQYRGGLGRREDVLQGSESRSQSHNVNLNYNDLLWRDRLSISSFYNASWLKDQFTSASGEIELRLIPTAGLSALDDTPEFGPLLPNPALVDGNLAATTGLDIGLPAPGEDRRPRALGLDFGFATDVDVFYVWVDRELRPEVARSFSWEIWTSDDNDTWVRRQALASAAFEAFDNRFVLRFPAVGARYVKVVVEPLDPAVPFATEYPDILVTELEPYRRVPTAGTETTSTRSSQVFGFAARAELLRRPGLWYEFSYLQNTGTGQDRRYSVTNALSLSHAFNPVWSMGARAANEFGDDAGRQRTSNDLSVFVTAVPYTTLRGNLIASVRREELDDDQRDTGSVIGNLNATPYRGIDVNVTAGTSRQTEDTGRRNDALFVTTSVGISPNPRLMFNLVYQDNSRKSSGGGLPATKSPSRAYEIGISASPLATMYFFGSYRIEEREQGDTVNLRTINFSWSPFPYGSLRFGFGYSEYYYSDQNSITRFWGPTLRWNITPRSFLEAIYQVSTTESDIQQIDRGTYTTTLHIAF